MVQLGSELTYIRITKQVRKINYKGRRILKIREPGQSSKRKRNRIRKI